MKANKITGEDECQKFYAMLIKLMSSELTTSIWTRMSSKQTTKVLSKQTTTKERKIPITKENSKTSVLQGDQWQTLIDAFKEVNPSYTSFYRNKTERTALDEMAGWWGFEQLLATIEVLPQIITQPYAPRVTKPTELRRDSGKLLAFIKQRETLKTKRRVIL